jgi:hypothetical protein
MGSARTPRIIGFLFLCSTALGAQTSLKLDPASCREISGERKVWVPDTWRKFERFIKVCDVPAGGKTVLSVMSVWAEDLDKSLPAGAEAVKLPKPLLFLSDGKMVGELPAGYPRDPPRTLTLTFTNWSAQFPHEIRLWLEDPSVSGDRYLPPLEWNENSQKFVKQIQRRNK